MNEEETAVVQFTPIGVIHSPFTSLEAMPIQPTGRASAAGYALIKPAYRAGLKDLDGFSHVILLYYLHRVRRVDVQVTPFLDEEPRGIFATRAPTRPNPIGLSVVRVTAVAEDRIHLASVDILDGTPLLDVKPYAPAFDRPDAVRIGWLAAAQERVKDMKSDGRFR